MKRLRALAAVVIPTLVTACADPADDRGALVLPPGDGKADAADAVVIKGPLGLGGEASARFTADLEFHGYEIAVRPGARVAIEVARRGTSSKLDTTLYVFGPRTAEGGYGTTAKAFDDDAGWGRQSRLSELELAEGGAYLVVLGTHDGRGRGDYRLVASCLDAACAPLPAPAAGTCHPAFRAAIDTCVADWLADPDFDPSTTPRAELIAQCADIEPMAGTRDALCAGADAPAELCALSVEALALEALPACRREAIDAYLDGACVFGERYRDLFAGEAIVVIGERVLTKADALGALEAEQIVLAVRATAHDDVETVGEAFAAVDEGRVHHTELWDASNRVAYTAYEVGAGDNSFGMIFAHGTTTPVAHIVDGDLAECRVTWGSERRRCEADAHCEGGARCIGRSDASTLGRCVDPSRDTEPAVGAMCKGELGCPAGTGLVCAGAASSDVGLCLPGWMRGTFGSEAPLAIPDGDGAGASVDLLVYGLATVSTDVRVSLVVSHPRTSDLRITLTNPAGTEVVVFDGEALTNGEVYLDGAAVRGFPGDESVNGVWRLTVVDRVRGEAGTLGRFALELTSRWD